MYNKQLDIPLLEKEFWWGGLVSDGQLMPYRQSTIKRDLSMDLAQNQANPLLLSNKGRSVWSEEPFTYSIKNGTISINSRYDGVVLEEGFESLRGAFQHASQKYFPASGVIPDELFFTAPQYNLWIELMYEPTQQKVLNYAKNVLDNGMKPGVIMIDDNWHGPYGDWRFHTGRFPDPKKMVDQLHEMGFKVMLWVCPFVSPDSIVFRQLEPEGFLIRNKDGETALRRWWNGVSAVIDFTNPEAIKWMHSQLESLQQEYGIDGFKFDAGDINFYRDDDQSALPTNRNGHCEAWAKLGLNYHLNEYRACWKLAGQPLVQRLKDKNHSWGDNGLASLIPDALALGLLGYTFICPDMIGGGEYKNFLENSQNLDQELFVRFAQCSALFPMMQFSAAPWRVLDQEHLSYCVDAAQLHSDLGDELVALAKESAASGEPILRHMAYEFPEDGLEEVNDQFMLGSNILVAPVITKGARSREVLFPSGTWEGDDGSLVDGPCRKEIKVPLSRLPWYRKVTP